MKVVINRCFGGFGLSHEGLVEYANRKGIRLYAFTEKRTNGQLDIRHFVPVDKPEDDMFVHYCTKPLKPDGTYEEDSYFSWYEIPRDDKDLVAVVEKLGEKSWGRCAELAVVKIPNGIDWGIHEYDGLEHVEEKHRTWP